MIYLRESERASRYHSLGVVALFLPVAVSFYSRPIVLRSRSHLGTCSCAI
jgi:hypothetical protein